MLRDHLTLGTTPVGLMVHIGAGLCDALDIYLDATPEKIILIEPNPEAVEELAAKIQEHSVVNLIAAAISENDGRAHLRVLNFADLSSLRVPTGLIDLLPGVRVVNEPMVDTLSFNGLRQQLPEISADKANWLVIEAPGEELTIAKALLETQSTELFQNVILRCSQTVTFEGSAPAPEVLQILRHAGYRLENSWVGEDPDWPYFQLRLDVVAIENARLKAQNAEIQKDMLARTKELAAANTATNREKEVGAATAQELRGKLEARTKERDGAQETFTAQFKKQEETLKKDLAMALRLQMLARNDHQDLQTRYNSLQDEKRTQEELLIKLTQKLGSAAVYLRQLSDQGTKTDAPAQPLGKPKRSSKRSKKKSKTR